MDFTNQLTKLLNIQYPIISAPMAGVSDGNLACAVSKAGGLGLIGVGYNDGNWLGEQLKCVKNIHFGVGFITWQLAQKPELLTIALNYSPKAIMLSFGDAAPFVDTIKSTDTKFICQIQSVKDAKRATDLGADIIVAQGSEAGGHGDSRGTFALVPAIVDAIAPIPVLAAGGIADGRGLAAALMLGASGVLVGTRFYASTESAGHAKAKQLIVDTSGDETLRSHVFDQVRGLQWPAPYTARSLKNRFTQEWCSKLKNLKKMNADERIGYETALKMGDFSIAGIFAGECIDLIHDILPAEAIIKKMVSDAEQTIVKFNSVQT